MVYCCVFSGDVSRQALLQFSNRFLINGACLTRLWLEQFFTDAGEAAILLNAAASNENIAIEALDLGQNPCIAANETVQALANLIETQPKLTSLGLDHCKLKAD